MKVFSGSKWESYAEDPKDTGWRNITSSINLSTITGEVAKGYIRRIDNTVHFRLEVSTPSTSNHGSILLIAGSTTNVLRKIGLPKGTAMSKPRPVLDNGTTDFTISTPWLSVSGEGPGVPTAREAELVWRISDRAMVGLFVSDVYEVSWITFDAFPTTFPGTAASL